MGIIGVASAASLDTLSLSPVQIIGSRYVYTCDGTEITAKEYTSFAEKDAPPVKCPVVQTLKFNTLDGKIGDNKIYMDNGTQYIKLAEIEDAFPAEAIKGGFLIGNTLTIIKFLDILDYAKD